MLEFLGDNWQWIVGYLLCAPIVAKAIQCIAAKTKEIKLVKQWKMEGLVDWLAQQAVLQAENWGRSLQLKGADKRKDAICHLSETLKTWGLDKGITAPDAAVDAAFERVDASYGLSQKGRAILEQAKKAADSTSE